jgi:amino acid transporter
VLILCATILTGELLEALNDGDDVANFPFSPFAGVISADALIGRLAADGLFPAVFHRRLPRTGAPFVSLIFFAGLSLVIYATTGASLTIMSGV